MRDDEFNIKVSIEIRIYLNLACGNQIELKFKPTIVINKLD